MRLKGVLFGLERGKAGVSLVGELDSLAGQAPKAEFIAAARKTLTTPGSTQAPSMYRDLQQGAAIEADQIIGDLLARGGKSGIATPLLAAAYAHMGVYQHRIANS